MVLQHFTQLNSPESCPATTTVFHKFGTRPVLTTDYLFIFPSGLGLRASLFLALGLEVLQWLHKLFFWDDAYAVFFVFFASGGIDGQTTYDPSSHKPAAMCETQTCKNILNSGGNTLSSRLWHLSVK